MKDKSPGTSENQNTSGKTGNSDGNHDLESLRKQIDQQDLELIRILAKRYALIREAAKCKIRDNKDLWDEKRVEEILKTRCQWAQQKDLDPELVEDIFRRLIDGNMQIERKILQKCREK